MGGRFGRRWPRGGSTGVSGGHARRQSPLPRPPSVPTPTGGSPHPIPSHRLPCGPHPSREPQLSSVVVDERASAPLPGPRRPTAPLVAPLRCSVRRRTDGGRLSKQRRTAEAGKQPRTQAGKPSMPGDASQHRCVLLHSSGRGRGRNLSPSSHWTGAGSVQAHTSASRTCRGSC